MREEQDQKTYIKSSDLSTLEIILIMVERFEIERFTLSTDIPNVRIELKSGKNCLWGYLEKDIGKEEEDWRVYSSLSGIHPAFSNLPHGNALLAIKSWVSRLDIKELGFRGKIRYASETYPSSKIGYAQPTSKKNF